jgi:hypothetical protein
MKNVFPTKSYVNSPPRPPGYEHPCICSNELFKAEGRRQSQEINLSISHFLIPLFANYKKKQMEVKNIVLVYFSFHLICIFHNILPEPML